MPEFETRALPPVLALFFPCQGKQTLLVKYDKAKSNVLNNYNQYTHSPTAIFFLKKKQEKDAPWVACMCSKKELLQRGNQFKSRTWSQKKNSVEVTQRPLFPDD